MVTNKEVKFSHLVGRRLDIDLNKFLGISPLWIKWVFDHVNKFNVEIYLDEKMCESAMLHMKEGSEQ